MCLFRQLGGRGGSDEVDKVFWFFGADVLDLMRFGGHEGQYINSKSQRDLGGWWGLIWLGNENRRTYRWPEYPFNSCMSENNVHFLPLVGSKPREAFSFPECKRWHVWNLSAAVKTGSSVCDNLTLYFILRFSHYVREDSEGSCKSNGVRLCSSHSWSQHIEKNLCECLVMFNSDINNLPFFFSF